MPMAMPRAGRASPRSARRPANGAATAPAAPTRAKIPTADWVRPCSPISSYAMAVQNVVNVPKRRAWLMARRRRIGSSATMAASERISAR